MKMLATVGLLGTVLALTGCDEDTFRVIDDVYECTHVEVSGTEYEVVGVPTQNTIGYYKNGLVTHSECTPSSIVQNGSETTYAYYQYGQPINGEDNIHSLKFWLASDGTEMLDATRIFIPQNGESVTREDGKLGSIQLMHWTNTMGTVTAENSYNGASLQQVLIEYGQNSKERTFNDNTQQWDCVWKDNGSIQATDPSCSNEAVLDTTHLGVVALGDWYWQELQSASRSYKTDEEDIKRHINDYYSYF
ncbi:hypothetical protein [Vibrio sp. 10N.239.312.D08]|uniref:hypothetical protein n=1 Tax=Vibrio sp. 10N.239.312.D08 TaxID=3229978 RepID=UPI0035517E74